MLQSTCMQLSHAIPWQHGGGGDVVSNFNKFLFQELIEVLGPALDGELEHLVPVLIKKAGIVSVAGRDNFLAVEADKALGTLVNTASEARVVTALLNCLSTTKAADVKGKISIHLDAAIQRCGAGSSGCRLSSQFTD